MSYTLKINYADKSNYGSKRNTSTIKFIVLHYTANDGDTDESNAKFFKRKNREASAHYFVDDDSVTISVPDTVVAWSVGGSRYSNYKKTGGAKYYKTCNNSNSISVEMCDTKRDGKYMASEQTMQNTAELVKELMVKYNVPIDNVITHFLVTGKSCPSYFVDQKALAGFKMRLVGNLTASNNGLDYSKVYDGKYYGKIPDLKQAFGSNPTLLFKHFLDYGMKEGRQATAEFNVKVYKSKNPDLVNALGNDYKKYFEHYITYGYKENRIYK